MSKPTYTNEPPEILHGFMQVIEEMPEPLTYTVTTWPEAGFQLCPKCDGEGKILAVKSTIDIFLSCPVCSGKMIINCKTGKPPET